MKTFAVTCYTLAYVLALTLLAAGTAHAQSIPAATQSSVVRARLVAAVDASLPAVRCSTSNASTILNVADGTRVVACGVRPGFEAAVLQGLGTVLAQLGSAHPSIETLETAELYSAYLESLVASRRPVEITFPAESVVARR